jgi:hypothetical protein
VLVLTSESNAGAEEAKSDGPADFLTLIKQGTVITYIFVLFVSHFSSPGKKLNPVDLTKLDIKASPQEKPGGDLVSILKSAIVRYVSFYFFCSVFVLTLVSFPFNFSFLLNLD